MHTSHATHSASNTPIDLDFRPDQALTDQIIDRLADPGCPLTHVAAHAETSIEILSAWMLRPEIAARIDALESATARRARLLAVGQIHLAARTAAQVLEAQRRALNDSVSCFFSARQQLRAAAISLSAGRLLLNLARFDPARTTAPRRARPSIPSNDHPPDPRSQQTHDRRRHDASHSHRVPSPATESPRPPARDSTPQTGTATARIPSSAQPAGQFMQRSPATGARNTVPSPRWDRLLGTGALPRSSRTHPNPASPSPSAAPARTPP